MGKSTEMGGPNRAFRSTRWTEIMSIKDADDQKRREILGNLLLDYWKPVYCYLRHKGFQSERAKDLTQGFFHTVILEKQLLQKAQRREDGRFRNYLLKALNHYVFNVIDSENAQKRMPREGFVSLDHIDVAGVADLSHMATPEDAYHYAWATEFLRKVCEDVKEACRENQLSRHWEAFNRRVLEPILGREDPPSLEVICAELGIESESKASNMIGVVKKRFRATMRRHLSRLVSDDGEINEEYRELLAVFSGN